MKLQRILATALATAALALAACQSMTLPTLDSKLAEVEAQVTATETSAAQAVSTGVMTAAQRDQVRAAAHEIMVAVVAARTAEHEGDMTTAQGKLAAANSLLAQLAQYAAAHGGGTKQ